MANQITPNPSVPSQVVAQLKFPRFVNNLGIIPTSYKDSMSYYETLTWLCKFLEETVIPTVNENGEAVEELQNLYIELNNYVSNYLDNYNFQEEVNKKLDELTESGYFETLITDYLKLERIYSTTQDMIQDYENLINGQKVKTFGYYSIGDEGSSEYLITNSEPSTYYEELSNGLYAKLLYKDSINLKQIGIIADGVTNEKAKLTQGLNIACNKIVFPKNSTIYFEGKISVTNSNCEINGNGSTLLTHTTDMTYTTQANNTGAIDFKECSNMTIKNLTINGQCDWYARDTDNQASADFQRWANARTYTIVNISVHTSNHIKLENIKSIYGRVGFLVGGNSTVLTDDDKSNYVTIDNCYVSHTLADGYFNSEVNNLTIQNSYCEYTGDDCFSCVGYQSDIELVPHYINFNNNRSYYCSGALITLENVVFAEASDCEAINLRDKPLKITSNSRSSTNCEYVNLKNIYCELKNIILTSNDITMFSDQTGYYLQYCNFENIVIDNKDTNFTNLNLKLSTIINSKIKDFKLKNGYLRLNGTNNCEIYNLECNSSLFLYNTHELLIENSKIYVSSATANGIVIDGTSTNNLTLKNNQMLYENQNVGKYQFATISNDSIITIYNCSDKITELFTKAYTSAVQNLKVYPYYKLDNYTNANNFRNGQVLYDSTNDKLTVHVVS